MYCNHCGALMGGEDLVCRACGKSVAESRTAVVLRSRVPEHLHLLAIFWFVVAGFTLIPAAGRLCWDNWRQRFSERAPWSVPSPLWYLPQVGGCCWSSRP